MLIVVTVIKPGHGPLGHVEIADATAADIKHVIGQASDSAILAAPENTWPLQTDIREAPND